jgi:hypothetical protein
MGAVVASCLDIGRQYSCYYNIYSLLILTQAFLGVSEASLNVAQLWKRSQLTSKISGLQPGEVAGPNGAVTGMSLKLPNFCP